MANKKKSPRKFLELSFEISDKQKLFSSAYMRFLLVSETLKNGYGVLYTTPTLR